MSLAGTIYPLKHCASLPRKMAKFVFCCYQLVRSVSINKKGCTWFYESILPSLSELCREVSHPPNCSKESKNLEWAKWFRNGSGKVLVLWFLYLFQGNKLVIQDLRRHPLPLKELFVSLPPPVSNMKNRNLVEEEIEMLQNRLRKQWNFLNDSKHYIVPVLSLLKEVVQQEKMRVCSASTLSLMGCSLLISTRFWHIPMTSFMSR